MCNFPYKFTQQLRGNQDFSLLKQYLLHPLYFEGLNNTVGVQGLTLTDGYFVKTQLENASSLSSRNPRKNFEISFTKWISTSIYSNYLQCQEKNPPHLLDLQVAFFYV